MTNFKSLGDKQNGSDQSRFNIECSTACKKESKRLNIRDHQKTATWKPGTRFSAKRMIRALMTKRNSPRVKIVTGRVNKTNKGLTRKFKRARTTARTMAVHMESTFTPGST